VETIDNYATYTRLLEFLDEQGVPYRLIEHSSEGRTELVSPMRGNALSQAAKCIILMVKIGKKVTRYMLAVVPGDRRVDLQAVKALMGATYVAFASQDVAERLAGSVTGTVLPFSFNPELELVVDHVIVLARAPEIAQHGGGAGDHPRLGLGEDPGPERAPGAGLWRTCCRQRIGGQG